MTSSPNAPVSSGPAADIEAQPLSEGIAGRVTAPDGTPIQDALIQVKSLEPAGPPIPEIAILSTADGSYRWRLAPGHYEVTATHPDYPPASKQARVHAGSATPLDFTMRR